MPSPGGARAYKRSKGFMARTKGERVFQKVPPPSPPPGPVDGRAEGGGVG